MKTDKKILLVAPQPFYENRGTPIAVLDELRILSDLGFQLDVATFPIGDKIKVPNANIIRSPNPLRFRFVAVGFSFRKLFLDLLLIFTVLRLVSRRSYDCIHGVEEGAAIALICKAIFGIPVLYDMQSCIPEQVRKINPFITLILQKITFRFEKFMISNVDGVITSAGLADHVLSIVPKKPVWECVFWSNDCLEHSESLTGGVESFLRPTIVYTGNFSSYQGLDLLIEAAAIMRLKAPDVLFLLVGGTRSDTKSVARLIKKYRLEETIQLIGRVDRSEAANYMDIADVLVLPRREGMNAPYKIFEYMKSKKAIVATDIPAHRTVLTEKTAFLVKPDAEILADGLLCAIQNKGLANKLAIEAYETARRFKKNILGNTLSEAYSYIFKVDRPSD